MEIKEIVERLEKEAKDAYEYALKCKDNSVQEHWFGQSNGFTKAIRIIKDSK